MIVPFMYNFRSLSNKLPTNFWSLVFFFISLPRPVRLFFEEKRKLIIFGLKNVMARGIGKIIPFVIKLTKTYGKITLKN